MLIFNLGGKLIVRVLSILRLKLINDMTFIYSQINVLCRNIILFESLFDSYNI